MDLYGAVVTQARQPVFFARHGVLDTPEGRTAMIILVLFPILERLQAGVSRSRRLARLLSETFVTDVDDSLREMGVGDMSVPKKVKRAAQALGERCLAYRRARATSEPVARLAQELVSTIPGLEAGRETSEALARYTLDACATLDRAPIENLYTGRAEFPAA